MIYETPRNRDAYATIRGYVYQVDRTVDRWLQIEDGVFLELERGEDIDIDALETALLTDDPAKQIRVLEQVKHREKNLTLKSPSAIEAIVNAIEHLIKNPSISLHFCYLTNANIGREQLSPFPNGEAGIQLWERIRTGTFASQDLTNALKILRRFFRGQSKPATVPKNNWAAFKKFMRESNAQKFEALIAQFEWSTGQTPAPNYQAQLCDTIMELGLASTPEEATPIYNRLFLYVLRVLCSPGIKRLTKSQLERQVKSPPLAQGDQAFISLLHELLDSTTKRIEIVEQALTDVHTNVRFLSQNFKVMGKLEITLPSPDIDVPPLVQKLCRRQSIVNHILEAFNSRTWININGSSDMGKTQLAGLVAQCDWSKYGWIRFNHSLEINAACELFDVSISKLSTAGAVCGRAIIIFDDLPRLNGDEPLSQRICSFVQRLNQVGGRLLTTSHFTLPTRILHEIGTIAYEFQVPPFADNEATDVFIAHGAPPELLNQNTVRFVNGLAMGHPLLLALAVEYLCKANWKFREEEFEALMRKDFAETAYEQTLSRLAKRLGISQRELLFRLTLATGTFTQEEVHALSEVDPEIAQPLILLSDLIGAWVQRNSDFTMAVSPLVSALGEHNLSPSTRKTCHRILADIIVKRGMNLNQAKMAINHIVRSEDFDKALILFIILLDKLRRRPNAPGIDSFLHLWSETKLPERASLGLRLCARSFQLATFSIHEKSISFLLTDIDELIEQIQENDGWAALSIVVFGCLHVAKSDPERMLNYLARLLTLTAIRNIDGSKFTIRPGYEFDNLIWAIAPYMNTPDRLGRWISIVDSLPLHRQTFIFQSHICQPGSRVLANSMIISEISKPKLKREWQPIIQSLTELEIWARRHRFEHLQIASMQSLIIIYGEHTSQIDLIIPRYKNALNYFGENKEAIFFLKGTLGRQFIFVNRLKEAKPLLHMALSQNVDGYDWEKMLYFLGLSKAEGESDAQAGLTYASSAANIAQSGDNIPSIEVVRALAELGLAYFLTIGGKQGALLAWPTWHNAAKLFLKYENSDNQWKDLAAIFIHSTSYFANLAISGLAPTVASDGGIFAAPNRGWFLLTVQGRAEFYKPEFKALFCWTMAKFADAAKASEEFLYWLSRTAEEKEKLPQIYLKDAIGIDLLPLLIIGDQYESAIQEGIQSARAVEAVHSSNQANNRSFPYEIDLSSEKTPLTIQQSVKAEMLTFNTTLVPIMLRIARNSVNDRSVSFAAGIKLATICFQFAETASSPKSWRILGSLFNRACKDDASANEFLHMANQFATKNVNTEIAVIAYIATAIHSTPKNAFFAQISVIQLLFKWYPFNSPTHRLILLPYVEDYWTNIFNNCPFYFTYPQLVLEPFKEALKSSTDCRVREILLAIRHGFSGLPAHLHSIITQISTSGPASISV